MTKNKLETWIWVLIYGGMLGASLGWFLQSGSPALGWTVLIAGALLTAVGVALIFMRARSGP